MATPGFSSLNLGRHSPMGEVTHSARSQPSCLRAVATLACTRPRDEKAGRQGHLCSHFLHDRARMRSMGRVVRVSLPHQRYAELSCGSYRMPQCLFTHLAVGCLPVLPIQARYGFYPKPGAEATHRLLSPMV